MGDKIIYRLDDNISFRKCSLHDGNMANHGDCTNYYTREKTGQSIIFAVKTAFICIVQ